MIFTSRRRTGGKSPGHGRRVATLLVLALVLPISAAGCGYGQPEAPKKIKLTVSWWGGPTREKLTRDALALYAKKHPNVTLTMRSQPYSGYYNSLETALAADEGPDIFQIDDNSLTEYASRGIALDLSPHLGEGKTIDGSKLPSSLVSYGTINGKPYAVASGENTPALVYDRTVTRQYGMPEPQIGWTYQQLISWAAKITKASGGKIGGTVSGSSSYQALWLWLRAQGKELYTNGKLAFTEEDLGRWFQLWVDAGRAGATPPPNIVIAANNTDVTAQPVVLKQAATGFVWSNQLAEMQKRTDHELGITAYPGDPRGQWARASMYWSIYKGSKNAAAAADVVNFLVNDIEAGKILGTERGVPANTDVRTAIAGSLPPAMRQTLAFEAAISPRFGPAPAPPPTQHTQITKLLIQASDKVLYNRARPDEAAHQLVTQAQQLLGR